MERVGRCIAVVDAAAESAAPLEVGDALFAAEVVVGGGFGGGGQCVVIGMHGGGEGPRQAAVEVVVGEVCHTPFGILLAGHVAVGIIPIGVLRTRGLISPGIPDGRKGDAGEMAGVIAGVVGLAAELVAFLGLAAKGVVAGLGVGAAFEGGLAHRTRSWSWQPRECRS